MTDVKTCDLVAYLDSLLNTRGIPDSSNALNGLQVDNGGTVRRIGAAVDASEKVLLAAKDRGCDFVVVHHGMLWDGNQPVVGARYRKLKALLDAGIALYGAHIPLDVHPELGNNAILARELGIEPEGWFGEYKGVKLGVYGKLVIRREALAARLDDLLGVRIKLIAGGPEMIQRVGVISGAAAGMLGEAVALGLDAFITGEGNHHTYSEAEERRINLLYGGHYATEVWGVRALCERLSSHFGIPWEFLDAPTGM